jgi:hypothetical protein
MTILLANTWSPHPTLLQSDAVPRYLATFVTSLLSLIRANNQGQAPNGQKVRFLLRSKDDVYPLQAAIATLLKSDAWEAAIVERLDDVSALERALYGVDVVLWADDGRDRILVKDGRVLLDVAAEMGVRRFVFRSQVQLKAGNKTSAEGMALYVICLHLSNSEFDHATGLRSTDSDILSLSLSSNPTFFSSSLFSNSLLLTQ